VAVSGVGNQKTMQQIIDDSSSKTSQRNTGTLGKDDFLNLLVTQLRYQDPLKPLDDKEFVAQMAQFSSLEQMQNMNSSLSQSQAYSLIGKHVTASLVDDKTKETKPIEGQVSSVKVSSGKVYAVVNGKDIPIERITDVSDGAGYSDSNLSQYTNLIGSQAGGAVYDSATGDIVLVNGMVKSLVKGLYEDYALMDGVNVDISQVTTPGGEKTADINKMKDYLVNNKGKPVDIEIIDRNTDKCVTVKGVLKDYTIGSDGRIKATLDQLGVSLNSITNINKTPRPNISTYTNLIGYNATGSIHDAKYTNIVAVSGKVESIKSGVYEDYAVMNGIDAEVVGIDDGTSSSDSDYITNYLEQHKDGNGDISLIIKDPVTGKKVTVTGKLGSYVADGGKIKAVINAVDVPVDSITNVKPSGT
jgi:flagellar basal-body rod modification protein FlgD